MRKKVKPVLTLLLCTVLFVSAMPLGADAAQSKKFPDVPSGAWYEQYLDKIMWVQAQVGAENIISGYPDGTFKPNDPVKRGEFLKMLFEATASSGNQVSFQVNETQRKAHWSGKYYTMAEADNVLIADPYAGNTGGESDTTVTNPGNGKFEALFPCTSEELNQEISRYEMAVILNNVCRNIAMQKTVIVSDPEQHISDYAEIPFQFVTAVEQMYGKGLLTGDENGYFNGEDTLTRAQAVTVLYRFLFLDTIAGDGLQEWAAYPAVKTATFQYLDPSKSFANWLRQGHVDAYGNLDYEARVKLFGNGNKTYFASSYDAAGYMETVTVPIWTVDKSGLKYSSTVAITVNKAVAEEVKSIFQMIYDDPEQFPIYGGWSAGGARYTDRMRHSWGCAIDINAYYNCECNTKSGSLKITCGYGWWPLNHADSFFAGKMDSSNRMYSIGKNESEYGYSVVKAFATYGWGWGGNGWSRGTSFDYMHFSVLPSGG